MSLTAPTMPIDTVSSARPTEGASTDAASIGSSIFAIVFMFTP